VTRSESYSVGSASEYTVDGEGGGGTEIETPLIGVDYELTSRLLALSFI
jgi:hypothetical protein